MPIIFSLYHHPLAELIAAKLDYPCGQVELRRFPDQESYCRLLTTVQDQDVILIDSLNTPDNKLVPMVFFAETAKSLGAKSVALVAPYLAYLRQDKRFRDGECISSQPFAKLLSAHFDWLMTVDPHLHRYHQLNEIYSIPTQVLHSMPLMAEWINHNIDKPLIVGPDSESQQWVAELAGLIKAPYVIANKTRHSAIDVDVSVPEIKQYSTHTPVLIDDIIASGQTMLVTIQHLHEAGAKPPVCIGVHAIFANNAVAEFANAKLQRIITCNTIEHASNQIDLSSLLAEAIANQPQA